MKRSLGVACALALSAGFLGGDRTFTQTSLPEIKLSPEQHYAVESAFNRAEDFWLRRGVGGVAATRLVILERGQEFPCQRIPGVPSARLREYSRSQYCPGNRTVAISAADVLVTQQYGGLEFVDFLVNHEIGHAVQDAKGELEPLFNGGNRARVERELQATCYAGMTTGETEPKAVPRVDSLISSVGDDGFHGTSEQQADAFLQGAHHGNCDGPEIGQW